MSRYLKLIRCEDCPHCFETVSGTEVLVCTLSDNQKIPTGKPIPEWCLLPATLPPAPPLPGPRDTL